MPIYVSLLRGINVGGNKKIKMADLRALYESLGFTDVSTLLQSGKAVFKSDMTDTSKIAKRIEDGIEAQFGFHSDLFVLTAEQFRTAFENNPFTGGDYEGSKLLVTFYAETLPDDLMQKLHDAHESQGGPETIKSHGNVLYVYFPDGMGRSKLADKTLGKVIKISGTGRNWNTMTKLLAIVDGLHK